MEHSKDKRYIKAAYEHMDSPDAVSPLVFGQGSLQGVGLLYTLQNVQHPQFPPVKCG